jgi:transposase
VECSELQGKHGWMVERTLAWLSQFRRLAIRYEGRLDIRLYYITQRVPGCALISWIFLN